MRSSSVLLALLAGIALAGCTSSSSLDPLTLRPSQETTSSVAMTAQPVPPAEVGAADSAVAAEEAALAAPDQASQAARQSVAEAISEFQETPDVKPRLVAMLQPSRPASGSGPESAIDLQSNDTQTYRRRFRDAKPINFGASSPKPLPIHGVDVSRWQGNIDWPKLRTQGANFAYIKATDGGDHLDPMFKRNWQAAGKAGLRRGAYHFFYWCRNAGEQADWFIRNVPRVENALPPVLDVEWNGDSKNCPTRPSRKRVLEKMQVFLDRLEQHYGQRPIIYTAPDFYRDNLKGEFLNHPFWLRSVAAHPSKVYPGRKWVFWQYSGSGLSHGVKGRIDLNAFHGSERAWRDWVSGRAG